MDLYLETFKKVIQGDEKAYEILFREYYNFLFAFATGLTGERHAAEEIVEDFFVDLWKNRKKIIITTSVRSYFVHSVHNRCINYLQREKHRFVSVRDVSTLIDNELVAGDRLIDIQAPSILINELETALEKAIEKLPENCREVFLLSRQEELSYDEIAVKLNISVNTVKYHIKTALGKLRDSLKDYMSILVILLSSFWK